MMRRRFLLIHVCLIWVGILVPVGVNAGTYSGGSGTAEDPYKIETKEVILALADTPEDYDKCFILTADIDLGGQVFSTAIISHPFKHPLYPDDYITYPFTGTFDGNGHKISNFRIQGDSYFLGLFGWVENSQIHNLRLEGCSVYVSGTATEVGTLAGFCRNTIIKNCSTDCSVDVKNTAFAGGLIGVADRCSIFNCYSLGNVKGVSYNIILGGLIGGFHPGVMTGCYATGDISGTGDKSIVGGLVGSAGNWSDIDKENPPNIGQCYSTGSVSITAGEGFFSQASVGGLIGESSGNLFQCYAIGSVSIPESNDPDMCLNAGGLVGINISGRINECYSTGKVGGNGQGVYSRSGGLVGNANRLTPVCEYAELYGCDETGCTYRFCNEDVCWVQKICDELNCWDSWIPAEYGFWIPRVCDEDGCWEDCRMELI